MNPQDSTTPPQDDQAKPQIIVDNALFLELSSIHPLSEFDEKHFLDLLEHSLSLSLFEKKRVIDAIPTLSQFQIDELHKVFEDEREEFKKLFPKEGETIREFAKKAKTEWEQLYEIYIGEKKARESANADQSKIDALKEQLGI